jgi:hypothetical protein
MNLQAFPLPTIIGQLNAASFGLYRFFCEFRQNEGTSNPMSECTDKWRRAAKGRHELMPAVQQAECINRGKTRNGF